VAAYAKAAYEFEVISIVAAYAKAAYEFEVIGIVAAYVAIIPITSNNDMYPKSTL